MLNCVLSIVIQSSGSLMKSTASSMGELLEPIASTASQCTTTGKHHPANTSRRQPQANVTKDSDTHKGTS